jgi:hypothetical protein
MTDQESVLSKRTPAIHNHALTPLAPPCKLLLKKAPRQEIAFGKRNTALWAALIRQSSQFCSSSGTWDGHIIFWMDRLLEKFLHASYLWW